MEKDYRISKRVVALLLIQDDEDTTQQVERREPSSISQIHEIIDELKNNYDAPLNYSLTMSRQGEINQLVSRVTAQSDYQKNKVLEILNHIIINPITAFPVLLLVLYYGLYQFVGVFGAGTIVDYLEEHIFGAYINPWVNQAVQTYIPMAWLQELLAKDYGIVTLVIRYAVAIILPIVGTFFLMFSIIEDSGYLPRIAMLVDRIFKKIGLNGRAVIPMTLGFGCDTMATIVSKTLESKREKVIATLLLALAIPCSAQLGVILGILSGEWQALAVWAGFVLFIFLFVGFLTAKLMPGEKPVFYIGGSPTQVAKVV